MKTRTILLVAYDIGRRTTKATVRLVDGKVEIEGTFSGLGEIMPFGKTLTPADGEEYFNGLLVEYRNPYFMAIEVAASK